MLTNPTDVIFPPIGYGEKDFIVSDENGGENEKNGFCSYLL
jgi:hypothetical protein